MKRNIIIILSILVFQMMNAQSETIYYNNGNIKKISTVDSKSGIIKLKEYYESGPLNRKYFKNGFGQIIGKKIRYRENGKLLYVWNFNSDGKRYGKWLEYDEDGNISRSQNYTGGVKTGTWKTYWKKDILSEKKEYDENGILRKKIDYWENGERFRECLYDSKGKIISEFFFDKTGKKYTLPTAVGIVEKSCIQLSN
ncbi:MAG: hypothetical protein AAF554_08290 [Bacteroidota bacterium]